MSDLIENGPQQDLRISLVQTELVWQQPQANRDRLAELLKPLAGQSDLIVLPEMFTSGFSMAPEQVAEPVDGPTTDWLRQQAAELGAAITGSVATDLGGRYCNRLLFVSPQGELQYYDKWHLFRMAGEHRHYQAGERRVIFSYRGWRILPLICYDLRFPVFSRNRQEYDLLLCVANWPQPRRHPWRTLLQARAVENLCYVAGVNRVGEDGNRLPYSGDSMLVDFKGEPLIDQPAGEPFVDSATLSAGQLAAFREKFPAWLDADPFVLGER